jgi:DNA gyrase subunit A
VNAIRLSDGDFVTSMDVVVPNAELLVVTAKGYGKRTPLKQYPVKGRYTGGVRTIADRFDETGPIVAARVVKPEDEVTIITANGIALRTAVENIRAAGRATLGVRVMALDEGDALASLARLEANSTGESQSAAEETAVEETVLEGDEDLAEDAVDETDETSEVDDGADEVEAEVVE